jgi:hypothetical protein
METGSTDGGAEVNPRPQAGCFALEVRSNRVLRESPDDHAQCADLMTAWRKAISFSDQAIWQNYKTCTKVLSKLAA